MGDAQRRQRRGGQFWDDIWHNCWKAGRKHFLGVILVDERGADSELVDGQQRVTTIFLLVLALRDLLKSRALPVFNPERWLKCAAGTALRLVLQDGPCLDTAFINALYAETSSQLDPASLSESKIIRAYRYFKTELESHLDGESDLTEFLDRTFDKVEVLLLSVEPDDRPAAIFETLNSRGRRVSPTDLVRTFLTSFETSIRKQSNWLARSGRKLPSCLTKTISNNSSPFLCRGTDIKRLAADSMKNCASSLFRRKKRANWSHG